MSHDPEFDHGDEAPLNDLDQDQAEVDISEVLPDESDSYVDEGINSVD